MRYRPQDMAQRGRIGAFRLHSRRSGREATAAARRGFLARFEREVDPESKLQPEERARRAEMALRAHMARLAYRSAKARRGSRKAKNGGGGNA